MLQTLSHYCLCKALEIASSIFPLRKMGMNGNTAASAKITLAAIAMIKQA
jgi:hypothetical protein